MSIEKLSNWNGLNKREVRKLKAKHLSSYQKHENNNLSMLSFPGAALHFEKLLIDSGMLNSSSIVGIQSYEKDPYVLPLINKAVSVDNSLKDITIYPFELSDYLDSLRDAAYNPSLPKEVIDKLAQDNPNWKNNIVSDADLLDNKSFNILDMDFCGPFAIKSANWVIDLFSFKSVIQESGVLFVNHLNGRERNLNIIKSNFSRLESEEAIDLSELWSFLDQGDQRFFTHLRQVLTPAYYIHKLSEKGYNLDIAACYKYGDYNSNSSNGRVLMYQWAFYFERAEIDVIPFSTAREYVLQYMNDRGILFIDSHSRV